MLVERWRCWFLSLHRWEQAAVMIWGAAILIISMRVVLAPKSHSVYPIFAAAGQRWLAGQDLYYSTAEIYRYSPLVTAFFAPFSLLPDRLSAVLWRLLGVLILLGGLDWWSRTVLPHPLSRAQRGLLFLLVAPLAIANLNNGQSNTLILGLLLIGITSAWRQRWNLASICLATACLFKLYPIALGLLLVVVYPRPLAWRFALALLLGLVLPYLFQHHEYVTEQYVGWWTHLCRDNRQVFPRDLWYRDVRLLCINCHIHLQSPLYPAIQWITAVASAGMVWRARRTGWPQRQVLALLLGLGCCWITVFGSATESSTYLLLAPAGAWAALQAFIESRSRVVCSLLSAGYGLLLLSQIVVWFPSGKTIQSWGPQPLGGLLLWAGMLGMYLPTLLRPVLSNHQPLPTDRAPAQAA